MKKKFSICFILISIIVYTCFYFTKDKELNSIDNICFYGKNTKTQKCETLDNLKKKNIHYSDFGYILDNEKITISNRFRLFKKRNTYFLNNVINNITTVKLININIYDLEKLNFNKISRIELECIDLGIDNIKKLGKFLSKQILLDSLIIENTFCANNDNKINQESLNELLTLNINLLHLHVLFNNIDDIEYFLQNTRIKNVTIGTCYKDSNAVINIKRDKELNINCDLY